MRLHSSTLLARALRGDLERRVRVRCRTLLARAELHCRQILRNLPLARAFRRQRVRWCALRDIPGKPIRD
jgi:hypothetical protein